MIKDAGIPESPMEMKAASVKIERDKRVWEAKTNGRRMATDISFALGSSR